MTDHKSPGPRARTASAAVLTVLAAALLPGCGDDGGPAPRPPAKEKDWQSLVDAGRVIEQTRELCAIGPRHPGSGGNLEARLYIEKCLREAGFPRDAIHRQSWEAPTPDPASEPDPQVTDGSDFDETTAFSNIIAVIPGRTERGIAFAAHYDSKTCLDFEFVGANDAAASCMLVVELARILRKEAGGEPREHPLYFVFFDGEESIRWRWADPDNRYGSRHFVEQMEEQGDDFRFPLAGLVLVDMIGTKGTVYADDENSDAELRQILKSTSEEVFGIVPFVPPASGKVIDDHVSFEGTGVRVVDLIYAWFDDRSRQDPAWWHTSEDTPAILDRRAIERAGTLLLAALPRIEQALFR